jgi:hypothetical protein
MRNAGAVIHSHGLESCLATMIDPTAKEFRVHLSSFNAFMNQRGHSQIHFIDAICISTLYIQSHLVYHCRPIILDLSVSLERLFWLQITHMEMIKGITGHGYYDELVVPIIENSAREYELTDALAEAVSS